MVDNSVDPRPLSYPLDRSITLSSQTEIGEEIDSVFSWPTTDSDERVNIVINLSLNEYVALASTIDVGMDIAYAENQMQIWYLWNRILASMTICNDVADCLVNNATVQQALADTILNSEVVSVAIQQAIQQQGGYNPDYIPENQSLQQSVFPAESWENEVSEPPAGCDLDTLWSGIFSIVTRLDDQARTILEVAITYNDVLERFGNFAGAIPIIGSTIQATQQAVSEAIPDLYNLFNAYSSQANMEAIACTIFELVCAECRYPTYEELWTSYAQNAVGNLDPATVNLAVVAASFITSSAGAASAAYHTMIILELFALYAGSKVGVLNGENAIKFMAKLGEDTPSNDWETLCDGCGQPTEWTYFFDFLVDEQGWDNVNETNIGNSGTQDRGILTANGWENSQNAIGAGQQQNSIVIYSEAGVSFEMLNCKAVYSKQATTGTRLFRVGVETFPGGGGLLNAIVFNQPNDAQVNTEVVATDSPVGWYARTQINAQNGEGQGIVTLHSIEITSDTEIVNWAAYEV